jgi:hypothetical protein
MRVIYLAHPVGAATPEGIQANLERAKRWYRWIVKNFNVSVVADWITCCSVFDDASAADRNHGLDMDIAAIERCDELFLVGGRISQGMGDERDAAEDFNLRIVDLTFLGEEPPDLVSAEIMNLIGERRAA